MEVNDRFRLYYILTCSYPHLRQLKPKSLKAKFKATKDVRFEGLPKRYFIYSMTRMQGRRYVMIVYNDATGKHESYCVNVDTLTAERLELNISYGINSSFVEGQYMLLVIYSQPMAILRDLQEIGQIEFDVKYERCKNGRFLFGRHAQQAGHSVYAVDCYARLYRIEWQDIKVGKYGKTLVKSNVVHFYVDGKLGLATLNMDNTLTLPVGTEVNLKAKVDFEATWTIVTCIAKCWIASGDRDLDRDGHAIMASVSEKGDITSTLKLKLTSNGYANSDGIMFAGIYSLHNVFARGRRGIMLAIERDGCCHLISVMHGRMSMLQSIASIVNVDVAESESERIVHCVTATGIEREFIVGGWNWTRRISLKLK